MNPPSRKSPDVATRRVLDETLLVPIRGMVAQRMEIFALNPVAAFVWDRLDGIRTVGDLTREVVEAFEVDEELARGDIEALVAELREAGLLEAAASHSDGTR